MTWRPRSVASRMRVAAVCCAIAEACLSSCSPGSGGTVVSEVRSLGLATIPWEGGSQYWSHFARAKAAGWTDPSFFPIGIWWDSVSSIDEANFDKSLGVNIYLENADTLSSSILDDTGMFWVGDKLNNSFTESTKSWVGYFLDDEVDGRYGPAAGQSYLASLRAKVPSGMFSYANFTSMVLENNMAPADAEKYVNTFTDVVSVDRYWYTIPQCASNPYYNPFLVPIEAQSCRSASSYGKTVQALRQRDAVDGKLQPIWQFVENLSGASGPDEFSGYITPEQLRGAVVNSLIHEARGIVYFNSSFAGPCQAGNVVRAAQYSAGFCGKGQVEAMGQIDATIHQLAPVLNTQSYVWTFGPGLDTMLKAKDGYAYIFAMASAGADLGVHELKLPDEVQGNQVEVIGESRQLAVGSDHGFRDSFANESSYHIYRVKI